ncbi:MAG: RNA polymerase sigma factor [Bacteroidota bacterium]
MRSTDKITDQELIFKCLEGDNLGYTELYNRYAKRIYNSINRIVWHTAEAEDILQETFCAVFSDMSKLKGVNSFEAWLRRMAVNRSISHLRRRKIDFSDLGTMELADESDQDTDEYEIFDSRVEDVKKSIESLSSGYRTIINLYAFEQLTHEEIAVMLGLSPSTVRTQYHRAKKRVLLSLKDKCYDE